MQAPKKIVTILNPRAAGGRTLKEWRRIAKILREKLGGCEVRYTAHPGHATEIAQAELHDGCDLIIAVGGDGTIHEIANGFLERSEPIRPQARLGIIPMGTGGDFQRSLGIPSDIERAVDIIAGGEAWPIDLGRVRLTGHDGELVTRFFVNMVSFGMGGEVAVRAKDFAGLLGGKAAFLAGTLAVFVSYQAKHVRLTLDGSPLPGELTITNVAIGNGGYHGGGMHPCPRALLDDGQLEVTTIDHLSMFELVRALPVLYSADIYQHPKVRHYRARKIRAESADLTLVEVDGEALGRLPLEIEILPRKLPVLLPAGSPLLGKQ